MIGMYSCLSLYSNFIDVSPSNDTVLPSHYSVCRVIVPLVVLCTNINANGIRSPESRTASLSHHQRQGLLVEGGDRVHGQ
jgi:hypothetical protein